MSPLSAGEVLPEALLAWPDGVWRAVLMPGSWDAMGLLWEGFGNGEAREGLRIRGVSAVGSHPTTDIRVAWIGRF